MLISTPGRVEVVVSPGIFLDIVLKLGSICLIQVIVMQ